MRRLIKVLDEQKMRGATEEELMLAQAKSLRAEANRLLQEASRLETIAKVAGKKARAA